MSPRALAVVTALLAAPIACAPTQGQRPHEVAWDDWCKRSANRDVEPECFGETVGSTPTTVAHAPSSASPAPTTSSSSPKPAGADQVLSKNKWRFRTCYSKALAGDPDAGGTVRVSVTVDGTGKVTTATAEGAVPATLAPCVAATFYEMDFGPQAVDTATFTMSVVFSVKK